MIRTTRSVLGALGAALLLGALVFLFVKTAGTDFRNDSSALTLLRQMKDFDNRWDDDAVRISNDFSGAAPQADFPAMMGRILQEADRIATRESFRKELTQLRTALAEKEAAFKALRESHRASVDASRAMDESLRNLTQLASARTGSRPTGVAVVADQLRAEIHRRLETFGARAPALERRVATLRAEAVAGDPSLVEAGGAAEAAGRAFLAARAAEGDVFRKFSFHTLGGRIDLSARSLSRGIEDTLDEKERWRVYLFVYALALLIATGYLGMRVATTQAQLRRSNEELEKRVSERTHDLSLTLKRLKESEAQLVQSEKMSSLGQMVAGVAHEINTPLAYVKNSVATARDRMPDLRDVIAE